MKKALITTLFALCVVFTSSANSSYFINDSEVETLLEESVQVNPFENGVEMASFMAVDAVNAEKNVWIAVALDFFLGGLAIHRVYLGGTPILILGYLLTFGGIFGLIPLGDLIVLVINSDDISKYVGSNAFIMW
ncbi:MAG: TM2 domain-containing protein [Cyclobacteriaceae bacterium]